MLSKYSKIILDVSHTLYDNNQVPLQGAEEFLNKYKHKIIILSNVGSLTGECSLPLGLSAQVATDVNIEVERVFKDCEGECIALGDLAYARSGDKGDMANIGVCARSQEAYIYLKEHLTAQSIKNLFQDICFGSVERYELDGLYGFNFLLNKSLGGGGSCTLRTDAQGKTFAQALCSVKLNVPKSVILSLPRNS